MTHGFYWLASHQHNCTLHLDNAQYHLANPTPAGPFYPQLTTIHPFMQPLHSAHPIIIIMSTNFTTASQLSLPPPGISFAQTLTLTPTRSPLHLPHHQTVLFTLCSPKTSALWMATMPSATLHSNSTRAYPLPLRQGHLLTTTLSSYGDVTSWPPPPTSLGLQRQWLSFHNSALIIPPTMI